MINQDFGTVQDTGRPFVLARAALAAAGHDLVSGLRVVAHHSLLAVGVCAVLALSFIYVNPDLADRLKRLSPLYEQTSEQPDLSFANLLDAPAAGPEAEAAAAAAPAAKPVEAVEHSSDLAAFVGDASQQQRVTLWLSKRYRVAKDATNMLVSAAYLTAREIKMDPLLILSVMAIESRFNPFAESAVGAQGLMQVMSKVHRDKFEDHGGLQAALNPVANIKVGSLILKDYVRRGGSVEAGLKMYVGAANMETDSGYGAKVLAEYRRLKDVAHGKSVPVHTPAMPVPQKRQETTIAPPETVLNETAAPDQPV